MKHTLKKVDISLFQFYEYYSDSELVCSFIDNEELEALYYLIMYRYKSTLLPILGSYFTCYNSESLQNALYDFFYHISQPTERDKTNRLKNYQHSLPFKNFICTACKNYVLNILQSEGDALKNKVSIDEGNKIWGDSDDCITEMELMNSEEDILLDTRRESENMEDLYLILALETINQLTSKERYILLTYLYCERYKKVGIPLYLSRQISAILGITEGSVKTIHSRLQKELREKYKK